MWHNGQILQRHEVERWIADNFPYSHFVASVEEVEEPEHNRVRIIVTVTGPNGQSLALDNERTARYYSLKALPGMPQHIPDWTA